MNRAFKYKIIELTEDQELRFEEFCRSCKFVYNKYLRIHKTCYEHCVVNLSNFSLYNKIISNLQRSGNVLSIPVLKKRNVFLVEAIDDSLSYSFRDLKQAYQNMYKRMKKGEKPGFPKFKNRRSKKSFRFKGRSTKITKISRRKAYLKIPKIGNVKIVYDRPYLGRIVSVAISKEVDGWYVSLGCEFEQNQIVNPSKEFVGIDRGISDFIYLSDNNKFNIIIEYPKNLKNYDLRKKKIQRDLSRKKKFSSNWNKNLLQLRKISTKISRVRKHFIHEVTKEISDKYGLVVLEKLEIKNMTKTAKGTVEKPGKNVKAKSGLNREILNKNWYMFENILGYKLDEKGGYLGFVPPQYTSQKCLRCNHIDKENRKGKKFLCVKCGFEADADYVGARNIERKFFENNENDKIIKDFSINTGRNTPGVPVEMSH